MIWLGPSIIISEKYRLKNKNIKIFHKFIENDRLIEKFRINANNKKIL